MKSKHLAVFALVAIVVCAGLAYGGYIDPAFLAAAPLPFLMGDTQPVSAQLRVLLDARAKLSDENVKILKLAETDKRDITAEEKTKIDANLAQILNHASDIKRLQDVAEAARSVEVGAGLILSTRPNVLDDPKRGFKNMGDFALAAFRASPVGGNDMDQRLRPQAAAPGATYGNEGTGQDGGFLVPTEFAKDITKLSLDSDAFLPMTDAMPVSGNSITFPSDETTPWGTNGVRVFWAAETAVATATKPVIKPNTMRLNKLFGLVPVTDELLADSPAVGSYLTSLLGRSIKWKMNDAIINGDGAGQPLGIFNSPALVQIAKEAGQATLTLLPANVAKMFAAMPTDYLSKAVWLITPDLFPALITLTLGNYPFWTPPSTGAANAPGGYLLGKPIIPTQTCQAFSSKGDIIFTTFDAYRTISKDGVQIAESMHLYFDADATAFRATFRVDGQPTFKQSIAQARGAQVLSPYITLQAR